MISNVTPLRRVFSHAVINSHLRSHEHDTQVCSKIYRVASSGGALVRFHNGHAISRKLYLFGICSTTKHRPPSPAAHGQLRTIQLLQYP
ncbi:hypothetical protein O181_120504 [Austropuccinia psidii MF-1]|uniref:Uncharacterized protein n=1 Tax=Austropuccinia psidii MF-1 TaxID=1389203 RepID=A0A9Q3Q0G2_9BASI|nr:hypothetical protein [Austropuccinia psidii MF-1]